MSQKKIQEQKVISISCTTICWVYRGGLPGILTCGVGWGGVGWGVSTLVFMCTHGTLLVCSLCTWYAAGVSCANVSRNRSVMFDCPSFPHLDWVQCISSYHVSPFCLTLSVYLWCMWYIYIYVYFMSVYICMQIVSNGNAVNYRWLLIFPPDLAKKLKFGHCQNIQWSIASEKKDMKSTCEQPHFIWKNTVKSTPWLQEQQTAADTHHM